AAAWRWSLTPALHGNVTTNRREFVDNTADVQNVGRVNHRTERNSLVDAEYELGARWRAVGGVFNRTSRNSQPATLELDNTVSGSEVGARYVFREGDAVAYRYRAGRGKYLNQPLAGPAARDFRDTEHEVRLDWQVTGRMSLQGRLARLDRRQDDLPVRNFSGYRGEVNSNWFFTGKTSVGLGVIKELEGYQTNNESYYDGYRLYVAPEYKATEKITARLRYEHGARTFKGALPGFVPSGRRDTLRLASLGVEYRALRSLTLTTTLQRDQRGSNTPGFDYKSNSLFVSALFTF
ncbi:MAG: epsL, partial [Polaromonas sp.]|nr:epsL [Polaromonas sp.]